MFGDLATLRLATVEIEDPSVGGAPYTKTTVLRTTTFTFAGGEQIFELRSPGGATYVMQSMSQIVDADLTLAELATLGVRLALPDGWSYAARTLGVGPRPHRAGRSDRAPGRPQEHVPATAGVNDETDTIRVAMVTKLLPPLLPPRTELPTPYPATGG